MTTPLSSVLIGSGAYLPENCVSNDELSKTVDTNDEWIRSRTGIAQRYLAAYGETTSDLAAGAAKAALSDAGIAADKLDGIIVATSTPDCTMPSTAALVQAKLGMKGGFAFDLAAACSGFVYALTTADALIKSGQAKRLLVIGAETMSRIVDWEDRGTCVLFGDGAGAWVLEAQEGTDRGIMASMIESDGSLADVLKTTGGVSSTKEAGVLMMNGREVFRHAVEKMSGITRAACEKAGVSPKQIDVCIPHQANIRILSAVNQKLQLADTKLIATIEKHANTSAASVPLAFDVAKQQGKITEGQILAMPVLGAGLVWGCSIMRL